VSEPSTTSATDVESEATGPSEDREPVVDADRDTTLLEREGDIAADYLEGLLDIADLDGDLDMDVEGARAAVSIVGSSLDALVGPKGTTLEALQGLTRLAVTQQTGARSRLMLDIAGYRAGRRAELAETARQASRQVTERGEAVPLAPMTAFERKVVHDVVATVPGVATESEGDEPDRRVVIRPA
jgi:spoIIIJ-associated protein